jgi:hypothetical protein
MSQCLAYTLQHKKCLLRKTNNTELCHIHQDYPAKLLEKIQSPNFFEGFVPNWRNHERLEIEAAIENKLLEIPQTLLQSLPQAIIYGPFYNWYCGFHLNDPWQHEHLATAAIRDGVRVHTFRLDSGNRKNVCDELKGILEAQKANPASIHKFLWFFILTLHRYRKMNRKNQEEAIEDLLESTLADNKIWSSFSWSEWLLKNEQEYKEIINNLPNSEEQKKKEIQNFLGLTRILFQEKLWERKKFLKITAKSKIYEFKEDLIAQTWHPTRYLEWCFDEDEKAEFVSDFRKSISELQRESTAIWNDPTQLWNKVE